MWPDPPFEVLDEIFDGGGVNLVGRVGGTVRRPAGPWTPAVHALLRHLAARGFAGAPRPHGVDSRGREILGFVPGDVPHGTIPPYVRADAGLRAAAALLRDYHDATEGFTPPPDASWYFPPREPAEVVLHGDVAPYNCVFRDGAPVAFIDFDTAHPAPRLWDVAYAAYRFAPLTGPGHGDVVLPVPEQARRLRLFCDAYGLADGDRAVLVGTMAERLRDLARLIRDKAAAGDPAFARHLEEGHHRLYLADAAHLERHADVLGKAVR